MPWTLAYFVKEHLIFTNLPERKSKDTLTNCCWLGSHTIWLCPECHPLVTGFKQKVCIFLCQEIFRKKMKTRNYAFHASKV